MPPISPAKSGWSAREFRAMIPSQNRVRRTGFRAAPPRSVRGDPDVERAFAADETLGRAGCENVAAAQRDAHVAFERAGADKQIEPRRPVPRQPEKVAAKRTLDAGRHERAARIFREE